MSGKSDRREATLPLSGARSEGLPLEGATDTEFQSQKPKNGHPVLPLVGEAQSVAERARAASERLENDVTLNNVRGNPTNPALVARASTTTAAAVHGARQNEQQFNLQAILDKPKSKRDPAEDFFAELVLRVGAIKANALRQGLEDVIKEHLDKHEKAGGLDSKQALSSLLHDLERVLERGSILELYQGQVGTGESLDEFRERLADFTRAELSRIANERSTREIASDALKEIADARESVEEQVQLDPAKVKEILSGCEEIAKLRGEQLALPTLERDPEIIEAQGKALADLLDRYKDELLANPALAELINLHYQRLEDRARLAAVSDRLWRMGMEARESLGTDGKGSAAESQRELNEYLVLQQDLLNERGIAKLKESLQQQYLDGWRFTDEAIKKADRASAGMHQAMSGLGTSHSKFDAATTGLTSYELNFVRRIFNEKYGDGQTWRQWLEGDFGGGDFTERYERLLGAGAAWGAEPKKFNIDRFLPLADTTQEAKALLSKEKSRTDAIDAWNLLISDRGLESAVEIFSSLDQEGRNAVIRSVREIYGVDYLKKVEELSSNEAFSVIKNLVTTGKYEPESLLAALRVEAADFAKKHAALLSQETDPSSALLEREQARFNAQMQPFFARNPEFQEILEKETISAIIQERLKLVSATILTLEKLQGQLENSPIESDKERLAIIRERLDAYLRRNKELIEGNPEFKAALEKEREKFHRRGAEQMQHACQAAEQIHYQMKGGVFGWTGAAEQDRIVAELKGVIRSDIKNGMPPNVAGETLSLAIQYYRDHYKVNLDSHFNEEFVSFELKEVMSLHDGDISAAVAWGLAGTMSKGGGISEAEAAAALLKEFEEPGVEEKNKIFAAYKDELSARTREVFKQEAAPALNAHNQKIHDDIEAEYGDISDGPVVVTDLDDAISKNFTKEGRLLVRAAASNDPELEEAARLFEYLERWNNPEEDVCKLLERVIEKYPDFEKRYELPDVTGFNLRKHLKDNLSGPELDWAMALLDHDRRTADAHKLRFAMGGSMDGTRTSLITDVFRDSDPRDNEAIIALYEKLYTGRSFDADLAAELTGKHEHGVVRSMIAGQSISKAQELLLCFYGDMDGEDWEQRAIQTISGLSRDEIIHLKKEFFIHLKKEFSLLHPNQTLEQYARNNFSGDARFDFLELLREGPDPADKNYRFKYQEELCREIERRYAHERSGDLSGFANYFADYGEEMDSWREKARKLNPKKLGRELTAAEESELIAIRAHFTRNAEFFREQKHAVANTAATVGTVTAVIVISVAMPASAPLMLCVFTTAGGGFVTCAVIKSGIKGDGYHRSEIKTDLAFAALDAVTMIPCTKLGQAGARKLAEIIVTQQLKARGVDVAVDSVKEGIKATVNKIMSKGSIRIAIMEGAAEGASGGFISGATVGTLSADWEKEGFFQNLSNIGYQAVSMAAWGGFVGGTTGGVMATGSKIETKLVNKIMSGTIDESAATFKVKLARDAVRGAVGGGTAGTLGGLLTADWKEGDLFSNLAQVGLYSVGGILVGGSSYATWAAMDRAGTSIGTRINRALGLVEKEETIATKLKRFEDNVDKLKPVTKPNQTAEEIAAAETAAVKDSERLAKHAKLAKAREATVDQLNRELAEVNKAWQSSADAQEKAALYEKHLALKKQISEQTRKLHSALEKGTAILKKYGIESREVADGLLRSGLKHTASHAVTGMAGGALAGLLTVDWRDDNYLEDAVNVLSLAALGGVGGGVAGFGRGSWKYIDGKLAELKLGQRILDKFGLHDVNSPAAIAASELKATVINDAYVLGSRGALLGAIGGVLTSDWSSEEGSYFEKMFKNSSHILMWGGGGLGVGALGGVASGTLRYTGMKVAHKLDDYYARVKAEAQRIVKEEAEKAATTVKKVFRGRGGKLIEVDAPDAPVAEAAAGAVAGERAPFSSSSPIDDSAASMASDQVPTVSEGVVPVNSVSSADDAAVRIVPDEVPDVSLVAPSPTHKPNVNEISEIEAFVAKLKAQGDEVRDVYSDMAIDLWQLKKSEARIAELRDELQTLKQSLADSPSPQKIEDINQRIEIKAGELEDEVSRNAETLRRCRDVMRGDDDAGDATLLRDGDSPPDGDNDGEVWKDSYSSDDSDSGVIDGEDIPEDDYTVKEFEYVNPAEEYSDSLNRPKRPDDDDDLGFSDDGDIPFDGDGGPGGGGGAGTAVAKPKSDTDTETKVDVDVEVETKPKKVEPEPETEVKPKEEVEEKTTTLKPQAEPAQEVKGDDVDADTPVTTPTPVASPSPPRVTVIHGPLPPRISAELTPDSSTFLRPRAVVRPHLEAYATHQLRPWITPDPEPTPHAFAQKSKQKIKRETDTFIDSMGHAAWEYRKKRLEEEKHVTAPVKEEPEKQYPHAITFCENSFHTRSPVMQKMSGCCPTCGAKGAVV